MLLVKKIFFLFIRTAFRNCQQRLDSSILFRRAENALKGQYTINRFQLFIYLLINTTHTEVIGGRETWGRLFPWAETIILNVPNKPSLRDSHHSSSQEIKPQWNQGEKILWSLVASFIDDTSEGCRASRFLLRTFIITLVVLNNRIPVHRLPDKSLLLCTVN